MIEQFKSNCLICGVELVYLEKGEPMQCYYCHKPFESNARCADGHFICDNCHSLPGGELIREFCIATEFTNPIEMAVILMRDERIKMHGPEHHFLVPAVLLAAYYNIKKDAKTKADKIEQAGRRSQNVLGGYCGFYGACGAAIGTGIFISLITGANPLSKEEWRLSNLMTSRSLKIIAEHGGPRCCKRDTFLALIEAGDFLRENLNTSLEFDRNIKCEFSEYNRQCLKDRCPFHTKKE